MKTYTVVIISYLLSLATVSAYEFETPEKILSYNKTLYSVSISCSTESQRVIVTQSLHDHDMIVAKGGIARSWEARRYPLHASGLSSLIGSYDKWLYFTHGRIPDNSLILHLGQGNEIARSFPLRYNNDNLMHPTLASLPNGFVACFRNETLQALMAGTLSPDGSFKFELIDKNNNAGYQPVAISLPNRRVGVAYFVTVVDAQEVRFAEREEYSTNWNISRVVSGLPKGFDALAVDVSFDGIVGIAYSVTTLDSSYAPSYLMGYATFGQSSWQNSRITPGQSGSITGLMHDRDNSPIITYFNRRKSGDTSYGLLNIAVASKPAMIDQPYRWRFFENIDPMNSLGGDCGPSSALMWCPDSSIALVYVATVKKTNNSSLMLLQLPAVHELLKTE